MTTDSLHYIGQLLTSFVAIFSAHIYMTTTFKNHFEHIYGRLKRVEEKSGLDSPVPPSFDILPKVGDFRR